MMANRLSMLVLISDIVLLSSLLSSSSVRERTMSNTRGCKSSTMGFRNWGDRISLVYEYAYPYYIEGKQGRQTTINY